MVESLFLSVVMGKQRSGVPTGCHVSVGTRTGCFLPSVRTDGPAPRREDRGKLRGRRREMRWWGGRLRTWVSGGNQALHRADDFQNRWPKRFKASKVALLQYCTLSRQNDQRRKSDFVKMNKRELTLSIEFIVLNSKPWGCTPKSQQEIAKFLLS